MSFVHPSVLYLALLLVPAFVALKMVGSGRGKRALRRVVAPRLSPDLVVGAGGAAGWIAALLQIIGIALVIGALARPQWGYVREESAAEGRNIIVAIDTSKSMLARDLLPDRFERARLAAQDLVRTLSNDRFGLIAFAGQAFIQAPLTIDHAAIIETLGQMNTNVIPRGGTNIENAVELATKTFEKSEGREHALILFTDGDDLEGDAAGPATAAREAGIMLVTVGVGTPGGDLIPEPVAGGGEQFVRDPDGNAVLTRLESGALSELAARTRGIYVELGTQASTQNAITGALDELERTRTDAKDVRRPIERFQWFLGAAFLCFAFAFLVPLVFAQARTRPNVAAAMIKSPPARAAALMLFGALALAPARAGQPAPNPYESLISGDFAAAMEGYAQAADRAGSRRDAAEPSFGLGAAAYRAGEFDQALVAYGRSLLSASEQRQETAHYNLGNTLYRRGETTREAAAAQPQPGAPPDIRQMEMAARDWQESVAHYGSALELNPDNEDAAYNNALVEEKLEELEQEIQQEKRRQQGQQGQEGQEGEAGEGQEGEGQQQGEGRGDGSGRPGEGQSGDEGDKKGGGAKDFENPSPEGGGDGEEKDDASKGDGKLEAMGSNKGSGSGSETSGDREVNPETGFSKFEARQLLENLADEEFNARPADRAKTNESYKNW